MNTKDFIKLCVNTQSAPYVSEKLTEALRAELTDTNTLSYLELKQLHRGLTFELIVNKNADAQLAVDLLDTLNALIGHGSITVYKPLDAPGWASAIAMLKGYYETDKTFANRLFPDKNADRARTAVKLQQFGVEVSVEGCDLKFTNLEKAYQAIEDRICKMGGRFVIEKMLSNLTFNTDFCRFILPHRGNQPDPTQPHEPSVPFNYILNIALKYLAEKGTKEYQTSTYYKETVGMLADVCFATMTVQAYSIWEDIFHTDKSPIDYLRDQVLSKSVFDLHQSSWSLFMLPFLKYISAELDKETATLSLPMRPSRFIEITDHIFTHRAQIRSCREIKRAELETARFTPGEVDFVISSASQPISSFNTNFIAPTDYSEVNFWNYPLALIDEETLLLLPTTIGARCWYEALLAYLRPYYKKVDDRVGIITEHYLSKELADHGIRLISGNYTMADKSKGECDGLIETSKSIILIESKKKTLTRQARSGADHKIVQCLADSLVASQAQAMRTSAALLETPTLSLTDENGNINRVTLNGRKIDRITLTLLPFGNMQDRVILEEVMKQFVNYNFSSTDSVASASIQSLNKYQNRLQKYLPKINEKRPFLNSWFLDLEKLMTLIRKSTNAEDLAKQLNNLRYITFGTHDFYTELPLLSPLRTK